MHSAYFNINIYIYVFCGMHFGCVHVTRIDMNKPGCVHVTRIDMNKPGCVHVTRIDMNKPGHEQTWMCPCYAY